MHIPAIPIKLVNSIGAGDAFNAGFIAGLARGQEIEASAKLGNSLAAICVSIPEIQIRVTFDKLAGLCKSYYEDIGDSLSTE